MGDFNILLSTIGQPDHHNWINTLNNKDLTDICRVFNPTTVEYFNSQRNFFQNNSCLRNERISYKRSYNQMTMTTKHNRPVEDNESIPNREADHCEFSH